MEKFLQKYLNIIFTLIILIGAALFITGAVIKSNNDAFFAHANRTSAMITEMKDNRFMSRKQTVYVHYMVGHEDYRSVLGSYDKSMRVGSIVHIFYDYENPYDIRWENEKSPVNGLRNAGLAIAFIASSLLLLRCISMYNYQHKMKNKRKNNPKNVSRETI